MVSDFNVLYFGTLLSWRQHLIGIYSAAFEVVLTTAVLFRLTMTTIINYFYKDITVIMINDTASDIESAS